MEKERGSREDKDKARLSRRKFLVGASAVATTVAGGVAAHRFLSKKEIKDVSVEKSKVPSPEKVSVNFDRIQTEVERARNLLSLENPLEALKSKYLVSALYYSDTFLAHALNSVPSESDESGRILHGIAPLITPNIRKRYVDALTVRTSVLYGGLPEGKYSQPLPGLDFGHGESHPDAVDIFALKGTPVFNVRRGIIVLAESEWTEDYPFSETSPKGGNSVIIFNGDSNQFYRYAHLEMVSVSSGHAIESGARIGTVGRTGLNASQARSASHVHLEINAYDAKTSGMRSLLSHEIKGELQKASLRRV